MWETEKVRGCFPDSHNFPAKACTFPDVGNSDPALEAIRTALAGEERSYTWLSRATGIRYKRLLSEIKHARRPLTLETAIAVANVLQIDLVGVLETREVAA